MVKRADREGDHGGDRGGARRGSRRRSRETMAFLVSKHVFKKKVASRLVGGGSPLGDSIISSLYDRQHISERSLRKRPRLVGANFTNKFISPDEKIKEKLNLSYSDKRDHWNNYFPSAAPNLKGSKNPRSREDTAYYLLEKELDPNENFVPDNLEKMNVETYVWVNKDDPNMYGEWNFEEWRVVHAEKFVEMFKKILEWNKNPNGKRYEDVVGPLVVSVD